MALPQRYFVAILPPKNITNRLYTLQDHYNLPPWEPSIGLHITLVSPFMTNQPTEDLISRLAPLIINRPPFEIKLSGLGRFDNEQSVIFIPIQSSSPLTALSEDAQLVLKDLRQQHSHPFRPHLTLANQASRSIVDEYIQHLAGIDPQEHFWCNRFMLLLLDEEARRWNVIHEFIFTP